MPPKLANAISERQLLEQVRAYAALRGWLVYHTFDSSRSEPGFPDLVLVRGERLIFAELKSERGKPTPAQGRWALALQAAGQRVYLWRPSSWPTIEEELR